MTKKKIENKENICTLLPRPFRFQMSPPQDMIYKDDASTDQPLYIIVLEKIF
jgi:hypothetical protein